MPGVDTYQANAVILERIKVRLFQLRLENGYKFLAFAPQRLDLENGGFAAGDTVLVELNTFDLSHGRLIAGQKQK